MVHFAETVRPDEPFLKLQYKSKCLNTEATHQPDPGRGPGMNHKCNKQTLQLLTITHFEPTFIYVI